MAVFDPPPVADRHPSAAPRDAPGVGEGGNEVGGEIEGVKARDQVEALVAPGQPFDWTDAEVRFGEPAPGYLDEPRGRVDAAHLGAARGSKRAELAASTGDVEHRGARLDSGRPRDRLAGASREPCPRLDPIRGGPSIAAVVCSEPVIARPPDRLRRCARGSRG
jgi:hypothetical protein